MTKAEEKAALFVEKVTAHREAKVISRTVAWLKRDGWSCVVHPGNSAATTSKRPKTASAGSSRPRAASWIPLVTGIISATCSATC